METKVIKLLPALLASSIKKIAESSIIERRKLADEEEKLAEQQQKVDSIKEDLKLTDQMIAAKTGTAYGFNDLFTLEKVETGEKNGKTTYKYAVKWKYPDTYLPTADPTTANTEAVEEAAKVSNNNQNFQE